MTTIEMELKEHQTYYDDDEVKEAYNANTEKSSPKPILSNFLDLGWGLESIQLSDPYKNEFLTLIYSLISFAMAVMVISIRSYVAVLIIAISGVILHTVVFVYCVYKYKHPDNSSKRISMERQLSMSNISSSIDKEQARKISAVWDKSLLFIPIHQFLKSFDTTFGRKDDPVFVRPYYFRFNMVLFGVITSIFVLCNVAHYKASPLDTCAASYGYDFIYASYEPNWDKPNYSDHIAPNVIACTNMVYIFDFCTLFWLAWIAFSMFDSYELKEDYYKKTTKIITTAQDTLNKKYIEDLYGKAELQIYNDVKSSMQISANIPWIAFIYIASVIFFFSWRYFLEFDVLIAINIVGPFYEGIVCTNMIMSFFKICKLSKYPVVIAIVFGEPIYCHKSRDILSWWQLRHIYHSYRMPIYVEVLNAAMGIGIFFSFLFPFWAVISIIENNKNGIDFYIYPFQFGFAITFISLILYCMRQFVAAHEKQKTHVGMLKKEAIRLEANKDQFEADIEEIQGLIQLISEFMSQFDKPIYIASIPMTNAVFAIFRGAIGGIALIIAAEIIDAS